MKIAIGADHAGFEMRQKFISFLEEEGHTVYDKGAYKLDPQDDYPDFIIPVAMMVATNQAERGIVIGGSGQGEAIAANRFKGVRAIVFTDRCQLDPQSGGPSEIMISRQHNDANVLSIGARFVTIDEALEGLKSWLATDFSGDERHIRRLKKIDGIAD